MILFRFFINSEGRSLCGESFELATLLCYTWIRSYEPSHRAHKFFSLLFFYQWQSFKCFKSPWIFFSFSLNLELDLRSHWKSNKLYTMKNRTPKRREKKKVERSRSVLKNKPEHRKTKKKYTYKTLLSSLLFIVKYKCIMC